MATPTSLAKPGGTAAGAFAVSARLAGPATAALAATRARSFAALAMAASSSNEVGRGAGSREPTGGSGGGRGTTMRGVSDGRSSKCSRGTSMLAWRSGAGTGGWGTVEARRASARASSPRARPSSAVTASQPGGAPALAAAPAARFDLGHRHAHAGQAIAPTVEGVEDAAEGTRHRLRDLLQHGGRLHVVLEQQGSASERRLRQLELELVQRYPGSDRGPRSLGAG